MSEGLEPLESSSPKTNLNTILLTIAMGVLLFIGHKVIETSEKVSAIEAGQVTRPEIEAKLEGLRKDYMDIYARVSALEREHH